MQAAGPQVRTDVMRSAVSDVMEGRPTDIADVVGASVAERASRSISRVTGEAPQRMDISPRAAYWEGQVERFRAPPAAAPSDSLFWFIREQGGIRGGDMEGAEVKAALKDAGLPPGMISRDGMNADDMAIRAWEAGYIGSQDGERPDLQAFYDALDQEARGTKVYREETRSFKAEDDQFRSGMDRLMNEAGVRSDMTPREAAVALAQHEDDFARYMEAGAASPMQRAMSEATMRKAQEWFDAEDVAVSQNVADTAAAAPPPKARAADEGIGAVTRDTQELDAIQAEFDDQIRGLKAAGALTEAEEASIAEAAAGGEKMKAKGKARDFAAICLTGAIK